MGALQIRDVPDDVRQTLAEQAAARGQSLQAFLLTLVMDEARRSDNLAIVQHLGARQDGSQLSSAQVAEALDQARSEREALLGNADRDDR